MTTETKPAPVKVTKELIEQLYDAQLDFTQEMIGDLRLYHHSDDSFGDQMGALELSQVMTAIWFYRDTERLDKLLNGAPDWNEGLHSYSQGVAPEFYDLNCRGLADEED